MPASPALAYPTKGGPVAGRHPGADPAASFCTFYAVTAGRAPHCYPNEPVVPMAPRIKTRDRIAQASLELFNAQGERSVTTNHIATHLGISPGNSTTTTRTKRRSSPSCSPSTKATSRVSAPARKGGSDGGRQDLLPGSATGRDVALPLPPPRPRAPAESDLSWRRATAPSPSVAWSTPRRSTGASPRPASCG